MAALYKVGVLAERRKPASQWADHVWSIAGVVPDMPGHTPWQQLRSGEDSVLFFAGTADLEFHRTETGNYRDNLATGAPRLWVVLRPVEREPGVELALVTADPAEGEAMTETGGLVVETVPMPAEIAEALAAFIAEHHVERVFVKRTRK